MRVALTPEIQDRIVQYVRAGVPPTTAAGGAGVPAKVFRDWLTRGRACSRGRYRALWEAVTEAEAAFEVELGAEVFKAAATEERVGFALLERRYAESYGRRRAGSPVDPHAPVAVGIHLPPRQPLPMEPATPRAPAPSGDASGPPSPGDAGGAARAGP